MGLPRSSGTKRFWLDNMHGELEPITITATHDEAADADSDADSDSDFEELAPLHRARMRVPTARGRPGRVLNEWARFRAVSNEQIYFAPPHAHAPLLFQTKALLTGSQRCASRPFRGRK